jgi:hypothetical protein
VGEIVELIDGGFAGLDACIGHDGSTRPGRDKLPRPLPKGEPAGVVDGVVAANTRVAEQGRQDVEAVERGTLTNLLAAERGETREQVDLVYQRVGQTGPDSIWSADQEWNRVPPLEQVIPAPAVRPRGTVAGEIVHRHTPSRLHR